MREIESHQKLLHADAPVHQIDVEAAAAQNSIAVLKLLRRHEFGGVTFLAEKVADQFVLARSARAERPPKFQDRDIRFLAVSVAVMAVAVAMPIAVAVAIMIC